MDLTEQVILKFFDYGVFSVLFVFLLYWVLKNNNTREQRYIELIERMAEKLDALAAIVETLQDVKADLETMYNKLENVERTLWQKVTREDDG